MRSWPLVVVVGAILAIGVAVGLVAEGALRGMLSPVARAERMARSGETGKAEALYWSLLERGPVTMPLLLAFLDNHDKTIAPEVLKAAQDEALQLKDKEMVITDEAIDAFLARTDLPPDVTLLGRFWRGDRHGVVSEDLRASVRAAADAEPPMPWANHVLGRSAFAAGASEAAAERFAREGLAFADHEDDLELALELWIASDDWDRVAATLADPRARSVGAVVRFRQAVQARDWKRAARWFVPYVMPKFEPGPFILSALAAIAWTSFCGRLGRLRERPKVRIPLYAAAFVLGVLSVYPTLLILVVETQALHLVETGNPAADIVFFTFGVGLREEGSKLLLFAVLLPILRRYGTKVDVLVCGAMVGLGFAAEENLQYLASGSLATGLSRYLMANFFHMSMTAVLATALHDFVEDSERHAAEFSRSLLTVIVLHGAYDFFLSSKTYGDLSYFSLAIFFVLARQFLQAVSAARGRSAPGDKLLETFAIGTAVVTAASYVYACTLVGPSLGAKVLVDGLLGVALIVLMFSQELRRV